MAKKLRILFIALFCLTVSIFQYNVVYADNSVYLGGQSAGFTMQTEGAYVVGITGVITENGNISPADIAGIKVGDIIISINGEKISDSASIENAIKDGEKKIIKYKRNDNEILTDITPALDINGKYRLGIYVKNSINGIGTITYIKGDSFASLGHPVLNDDGELLKITGGDLFKCNITGVVKGMRGKAGELRGAFINNGVIGRILLNKETGVYGKVNNYFFESYNLTKIDVGSANPGKAQIYSTVSGNEVKEYSISIIKVDMFNRENKNFVIKIEDENLLNITNGIVQGMSGSPIVQNGKLVGAVTHVFINDPTRGFGIAIDKMLNN